MAAAREVNWWLSITDPSACSCCRLTSVQGDLTWTPSGRTGRQGLVKRLPTSHFQMFVRWCHYLPGLTWSSQCMLKATVNHWSKSLSGLTRRNGAGHLSTCLLLTQWPTPSKRRRTATSTRWLFAFTRWLFKAWYTPVLSLDRLSGRRDKSLHKVRSLTELPPVWLRGQHLWNTLVKSGSLLYFGASRL